MRVMVVKIDHAKGRARRPWQTAQRAQIGLHHIIAIARRPARRLIALHGIHLDIRGQKVIAAMGFIGVFDEMRGVKALAHQAALHIDKGDHDGVDLARLNGGFQGLECQIRGHG